jgi:Protein of unknown function (DUF3574)
MASSSLDRGEGGPRFVARIIATVLLAAALAGTSVEPARAEGCSAPAAAMQQVELFFGTAVKGHAAVAPRAWSQFLAAEVTPRFPDGLTIFDAHGQWRAANGRIVREGAHVLVVLYRPDATSEAKIAAIRGAYEKRFHQDSVMRVDSTACVSF